MGRECFARTNAYTPRTHLVHTSYTTLRTHVFDSSEYSTPLSDGVDEAIWNVTRNWLMKDVRNFRWIVQLARISDISDRLKGALTTLNHIVDELVNVYGHGAILKVAPTGAAAILIGGQTIQSFPGPGVPHGNVATFSGDVSRRDPRC
jgi:hypothetical protein